MNITNEEYEQIKDYVESLSYFELIYWRNEMIKYSETRNFLFDLLNKEIINRAYEMDKKKSKK